ncbi:GpE family phage tail protein [Cupriavidus sp. SW-Y-13]|nr:GpE family phage tail protein [Cupriavidus sp. SW-Y-13]
MRHGGQQFFAAEVGEGRQLPERVEDAIADVAVIFHWPPEVMYAMGVAELMAWRQRAYDRSGADE